MEIRHLTHEELSDASFLLNEYRIFYKQPSDLEAAAQFLKERLDHKDSIVYIAVIGEEAVGFVQLYPTFSTVALKPAYILNDLYVLPSAREKGVAQALINQCYDYCEQNNARYITLETAVTNKNAQKLYEKMGMRTDDDVYHYVKYF
ncbi:ribosomal protein S18 acetylase RimI-like enzyme [Bacillus ectoiniformans]|uniref:GNAT family N-acetyltransferase n=1 Tax=Bacillus ectoiniformans TaxID=1494429 RepID=UPI001EF804DF|nr:GNAT family N-acetyltransferase [Bacillus ectoiniformans]MBM7648827.1 ribosomal protein S18 acetylase RimI-like enzyme [Bacillus ectoiniformans]